jgi:hypothetical protein
MDKTDRWFYDAYEPKKQTPTPIKDW